MCKQIIIIQDIMHVEKDIGKGQIRVIGVQR